MKKTFSFLFLFLVLVSTSGFSQRAELETTSIDFNKQVFNPAYAGNRNGVSITNTFQNLMLDNFKDSRKNNLFSVHAPLINQKIGIGFSMLYNQINPIRLGNSQQFFNYNIDLSYKLRLGQNKNHLISFGVSANLHNRIDNEGYVGVGNSKRPKIMTKNVGNFGLGIYYQTNVFYAGFSIPKILDTYLYSPNVFAFNPNQPITNFESYKTINRNYIFMFGGIINLNLRKSLQFLPSTFLSIHENLYSMLKLNTKLILKDKYWLGIGYNKVFIANLNKYQTPNTLVSNLGVNIFDRLDLSYAFHYHFHKKGVVIVDDGYLGGHELTLRLDIDYYNKEIERITRYF